MVNRVWPAAILPATTLVGLCLVVSQPPTANAIEVLTTSSEVIEIESGKGALVRLGEPAASVFIAEPEIADIQVKSPRLFYVFGLRPGETTLYAVDEQDTVLLNRRVTVTHNLSRLQRAIAALLPESDVNVRTVEGSVVLSGLVPTAADSETARRLAGKLVEEEEDVINRLSVATPSQINLRVRVAEVRRDVDKQLGINWNNAYQFGEIAFGFFTENPVAILPPVAPLVSFIDPDNPNLFVPLLQGGASLPSPPPTRGFTGRHNQVLQTGAIDSNVLIDALEREGLLTILAQPNLTAISGETATFLAGGEFPVATVDEEGRVTIEFKEFGVSVAFTPTLVNKDRVSLRVRPEVSELSIAGQISVPLPGGGAFSIPALTTRRAETTVELGSGQSFMIAGLLRNDTSHSLSKFPWLGDIPIIGALFRSDSFARNETELLIIVTPYLVRPTSARIAAPTDGYVPPNDFQRYVFNRRYEERLPEVLAVPLDRDGGTLLGPVGFVLE